MDPVAVHLMGRADLLDHLRDEGYVGGAIRQPHGRALRGDHVGAAEKLLRFVRGESEGAAVGAEGRLVVVVVVPVRQQATLDQRFDLAASKERILEHDTVWVVHANHDKSYEETMRSFGYHDDARFTGTGSTVVRFTRE